MSILDNYTKPSEFHNTYTSYDSKIKQHIKFLNKMLFNEPTELLYSLQTAQVWSKA